MKNNYAERISRVAMTLEQLEITASVGNLDKLLGCQMELRKMAAEMEADAELKRLDAEGKGGADE